MKCPLCENDNFAKSSAILQETGEKKEMQLLRCSKCDLLFAEDYSRDRSHVYSDHYATWSDDFESHSEEIARAKRLAFHHQLKRLAKHLDPHGKKLLDIGTGGGFLIDVADKMGIDAHGLDISEHACEKLRGKFGKKIFCGSLSQADYPKAHFDVISLTDVLEHIANPVEIFKQINHILQPNGLVFIISPDASSLTRKILGKNWFQHKEDHILFFNRRSLSFLIKRTGFELIDYRLNLKKYTLSYYRFYFEKYELAGKGKGMKKILSFFPQIILDIPFPNPITGEFLAIARKK